MNSNSTSNEEIDTESFLTPSTSKTTPLERPGIMKPDIVFFGEGLGDEFHKSVAIDKNEVDLLIMIGSSLKVRPVALIPSSIAPEIPQILINREPLSHLTPDVELLGDCDGIINQICLMLGDEWKEPVHRNSLSESQELLPDESDEDEEESTENTNEKTKTGDIAQEIQENSDVQTKQSSVHNSETKESHPENENSKSDQENTVSTSEHNVLDDEKEKSDLDSKQRLMAKYWKPRKSLAHRLKGWLYI